MYKFICLFVFIPFTGLAQHYKLSGSLNGNQKPVSYATVQVQNVADTSKKQNTFSNNDGIFIFENLPAGDYRLKVTIVGFKIYNQQIKLHIDLQLPEITLAQNPNELNEVVVMAKRPTITRKIDRIDFNVENTILSSSSAWEIVKRAPGVQSGGDQLAVRGSRSIIVTINDKKVTLSGDELKAFLESTAGNDIKSVEVITNPPASYEASGNAVINIKMKANHTPGYKGSIGAGYTQGIYAKGNMNTSQYYKTGKLAIFGSYNIGRGIYYNEIKEVTNYAGQQQTWMDILRRKNYRDAEHTYRLNFDYAIDSLNTISAGTDGYIAKNNHALYSVPTTIYQSGAFQSAFDTQNTRRTPNTNVNINLGYDHRFSVTEKLSLAADYTNYQNTIGQDVRTSYQVVDPHNSRFVTDTRQHIRLFSAQADYSKDSKVISVQVGAKFSRVQADNFLDFRRDTNSGLVIDPALSNTFLYRESVSAGYISVNKDWGTWSFKAGLRGEYTDINSSSISPVQINRQGYFNLFPTVFLQHKVSPDNQLGLSYGKRITRPPYNFLNPSRSYFSPNSYLMGDANLKPALTDQYSLLYTYKSRYNAELYFINEQHPTIQLPFQDNATNTLIQNVTNIPGSRYYGIDLSTNLQSADWWSLDINPGAAILISSFPLSGGGFIRRNVFSINGTADNQLTLNKKAGFTANVSFNFNTAGLQGPATVSGMSSLNIGAKKKLFSDLGEVSLSVNDIYRGQKMKVTSDYADQHNYFTYYGDTQNFRISFKYNLGNAGLKGKEQKQKTDEQKRL
ncbi:outer membrane beta-barrel family protein [Pedobacter duraquae]|uniref:Outer membrane receptor protein involved in Fe transport n=1 Tax=Pedobacter duraquae TaxID=425511 RepID=A0A4R6INN3_9SPHI|nr:outer membrane beta-barrel family protein [Pedobacter duraquae]TDO23777.1 outer membrane receptor protein involved in Fe transport [Pedobacter duraquae]